MTESPVAVFSGGGTGGHLYPTLALAAALSERRPDVHQFFVGAERGLEARVLPERGLDHMLVPVEGLPSRFAARQSSGRWTTGSGDPAGDRGLQAGSTASSGRYRRVRGRGQPVSPRSSPGLA